MMTKMSKRATHSDTTTARPIAHALNRAMGIGQGVRSEK